MKTGNSMPGNSLISKSLVRAIIGGAFNRLKMNSNFTGWMRHRNELIFNLIKDLVSLKFPIELVILGLRRWTRKAFRASLKKGSQAYISTADSTGGSGVE